MNYPDAGDSLFFILSGDKIERLKIVLIMYLSIETRQFETENSL